MAEKTKTTKWTPNETQKKFMDILRESKEPLTLAQVNEKADGLIRSGSINCLITKGLVKTEDKEVQVVKTEVRKVYSLTTE